MNNLGKFKSSILKYYEKTNVNGYVINNSDNLLEGVHVSMFQDDLMQGGGNELKSKFNAIYSSSALVVNNFAIIKLYKEKFQFLNESKFTKAQFERQFSTGLSRLPPNLDFTLENNETILAFESKYLENLKKSKANFAESYNKDKLDYLDSFWFKLIEQYRITY